MTPRIVIIDYGMGNLRSVSKALERVAGNATVEVTSDSHRIMAADRVVFPGQGAMPDCMRELRQSGLLEAVLEAAAQKPLFGVCVGMQMLLEHSAEGGPGGTPCLGLMPGQVVRFELDGQVQPDGSRFKVPQMGWNKVRQTRPHPVWQGVPDHSYFYFVHSFYARPLDVHHTAGETDYGQTFTSAISRDNIFATQFHPEKSQAAGLELLRGFGNLKA